MDDRERRIRQRLKDDFTHYAPRCLRIRTKTGSVESFTLNEAQRYIHDRLERQLAETGKVRALILKGRQQGASTYVEGRFYWKVSHRKGVQAYILTHVDDATANLFGMAKRYHEHCPEMVKPSTRASNAKELIFDRLDSGYKVGTAGSKGAGRSATIQLFHGSEVAYWPNAETHVAGALQAVPDAPGSEVILESTSDGPKGMFYDLCMAAAAGESEYQLIFVPWFWQSEYRKEPPKGFELTPSDRDYKAAHGLDDHQMAWRRAKLIELGGLENFQREYPATITEAFTVNPAGRAYRSFERHVHLDEKGERCAYRKELPLLLSLDFNVNPMTASIHQIVRDAASNTKTLVTLDELWLEDSGTDELCRKFVHGWGHHKGQVIVYGDAAGNARSTKTSDSDYDIVRRVLRAHWQGDKGSVLIRVPDANGAVKDRVNAVNLLLRSVEGRVGWYIAPKCKRLVRDLELVKTRDGSGDLDKRDSTLTHMSDNAGYLVVWEFPVKSRELNLSGAQTSGRRESL